jgi:hypothetical protein
MMLRPQSSRIHRSPAEAAERRRARLPTGLQRPADLASGVRRTGNEPDRRRFRDLQERTLQSIYKRTEQSDDCVSPNRARSPPMIARRVLLFVFAGALALVTACGGSSNSSNSQPAKSPAAQTSSAQSAPTTASNSGGSGGSGSNANGIPQNNGGDHDGDNSGGPSDGDGNL